LADTIFDRIIRREIPADIVYEDDQALAFRDVDPTAPVHVLVIPKRSVESVGKATVSDSNLLGHLMWVAAEVARKEGIGDGFRIVSNSGTKAGQSVFHLHLHVLGGRPLQWPPG
jgi:histidine triad (HIT) family protein